jgi:proline iminopeptidase
MVMTYPPIDPYGAGLLGGPDCDDIYWEVSGNPDGKPALYLHGGPGSSLRSWSYRRHFDLQQYRIVGIDQPGCGQSRPLVTDALGGLPRNTTQSLLEESNSTSRRGWCQACLGEPRSHSPKRVSELVLVAITTTSREEVDWITEGVGRIYFPKPGNGSSERLEGAMTSASWKPTRAIVDFE